MSMKNPRVARRYARALMSVAEEQGSVDATSEALAMAGRVVGTSRELKLLLASPMVAEARKASVMREVFEKRIGALPMAFIDLLLRKHREVFLEEVIARFQALRDELRGVVIIDVTTAIDLQPEQVQVLTAELERRTGKKVMLHMVRDSGIMGGLVIKIGDTMLDGSVSHQLARLREQFAGSPSQTTI